MREWMTSGRGRALAVGLACGWTLALPVGAVAAKIVNPVAELQNVAIGRERAGAWVTPSLLAGVARADLAYQQQRFATTRSDPERVPDPNACTTIVICQIDPRVQDWTAHGGIVRPVLFTARSGATLAGRVWASRAGPARRPGRHHRERLDHRLRTGLLVRGPGPGGGRLRRPHVRHAGRRDVRSGRPVARPAGGVRSPAHPWSDTDRDSESAGAASRSTTAARTRRLLPLDPCPSVCAREEPDVGHEPRREADSPRRGRARLGVQPPVGHARADRDRDHGTFLRRTIGELARPAGPPASKRLSRGTRCACRSGPHPTRFSRCSERRSTGSRAPSQAV